VCSCSSSCSVSTSTGWATGSSWPGWRWATSPAGRRPVPSCAGSGRRRSWWAVTLLAAAGYLGAAATSSPYLAGAFLGVEAVGVVVGNVATASFRQRTTPAPLQARVANVWKSIVWGVIPLGALAGGVVGSSLGLRAPFTVAAGLQVILAIAMARPLHRLIDRSGATG
jgi:hypothetical protein